ncbi:MAG: hypothetical protein EBX38_03310 [Actinobacteria bacterium]|nr:hypothetical protein [Actinomycetota bacterium]
MIKVMNLVSLLILPAVINLRDNDAARYGIAGVSLAILLFSIYRSSQKSTSFNAA